MKKLIFLFLLTPLTVYPQSNLECGTPTACYELQQRQRAEAIRLKNEREQAVYRQQQLELEAAQLRELQEQRAVLEEELSEMNETQMRMEERELQKAKEEKAKGAE